MWRLLYPTNPIKNEVYVSGVSIHWIKWIIMNMTVLFIMNLSDSEWNLRAVKGRAAKHACFVKRWKLACSRIQRYIFSRALKQFRAHLLWVMLLLFRLFGCRSQSWHLRRQEQKKYGCALIGHNFDRKNYAKSWASILSCPRTRFYSSFPAAQPAGFTFGSAREGRRSSNICELGEIQCILPQIANTGSLYVSLFYDFYYNC